MQNCVQSHLYLVYFLALTLHTINGSLLNKIACHFHHAILVTMDTKR